MAIYGNGPKTPLLASPFSFNYLPLCRCNEPDTWLHVLLRCTHPIIHGLRTKRHNKAVWAICKLLVSTAKTQCFILMNAGTYNDSPPDNSIPEWLLPCTCQTPRCHCNSRLRPDILCLEGHPYGSTPPPGPSSNLTVQIIEFTYCNHRFSPTTILEKMEKYQPLIDDLIHYGWKVNPLIVITTGPRSTTHSPSLTALTKNLKIPLLSAQDTLIHVNSISIQHLSSIILHKGRLENHQTFPQNPDPY
jgi:hypothetical protein